MYGGLQCENIVQAGARDIMVDAMFRTEAKGYELVLTVHDELLAEVDETSAAHTVEDFQNTMAMLDPVYAGLPMEVKAWEDKRYVK